MTDSLSKQAVWMGGGVAGVATVAKAITSSTIPIKLLQRIKRIDDRKRNKTKTT